MRIQTQFEEIWNTITHGVGAILGIIGLILFVLKDTDKTAIAYLVLLFMVSL